MTKTMENLKERFCNWKDALESKGLEVNIRKTNVMVSGLEGEHVEFVVGESWPI